MNLAKTASVKSVTTDTKILDAKRVETTELLVDGVSISEVVPKWKPREHIYRCVLEEDDDYIIYDDEGNFLDCKLDKLENGTNLFQYAKGVENFSFSLPSLTTGSGMFADCNLGKKAVESILHTIPEYSEGSHLLTMSMSGDAFEKFNEITGNYLMEPGTISYKGWEITSNIFLALPTGYRRVEYLESTGTQWIDSHYIPNNETGLYTKHLYLSNGNTRPCGTIGTNKLYAISVNASTGLAYGFGQTYHSGAHRELYNILQEGYVNYFFNDTRLTQLNINDELFLGWHAGNIIFDGNSTIFLFTLNIGDGTVQNMFVGRIYSIKISQGSEIVHNFVPCIDNLGNPCMYDTITKETFCNDGSGTFLTPESVTTYSLRRPVPTYAKMTAHGVQKIYHLPEGYEGSEDEYAQENGFKLLTENERPEEGSWRPEWTETDNELILNWIEVEEEELTNV